MGIIVQKFGGTSVGSADRIQNVAKLIEAERKLGNQVVVVVSAMSGVTDSLAALANGLIGDGAASNSREYDVVLSSGEIASAGLLALALNKLGIKAQSFQGWQVQIKTDDNFNDSNILEIETGALIDCIKSDIVPVICGFQGVHEASVTTLGRGGSDTTAIAVASALKATVCDIYTDVDGVHSIDPNKFLGARKIDIISYDEMISLAHGGAKVLHPRAAEIAKKNDLEVRIRSSLGNCGVGTTIKYNDARAGEPRVIAIAMAPAANDDINTASVKQNLSKITIVGFGIKHDNQIIEKVFQIIQNRDIKVVQSAMTDISISLYVADVGKELAQDLHNALIGSALVG